MSVSLIPKRFLDKRVFVAGGYAIYCDSMLWAVGIAERLSKKHKMAETDCRLFGSIEFRGQTFFWVRFAFLRHPAFYEGTIFTLQK